MKSAIKRSLVPSITALAAAVTIMLSGCAGHADNQNAVYLDETAQEYLSEIFD